MQGNRGNGDPFFGFGDPFAGFGGFSGFAGPRNLLPGFFGGRDPFDDPFFTRPFGGVFESSFFGPAGNPFSELHAPQILGHQVSPQILGHQVSQPNRPSGPVIEELNSDDEREQEDNEKKDKPRKHGRSNKEPYVEEPEDEAEGRKRKQMQYMNDLSRVKTAHSRPQTHSFTFQSSSVTYGGTNGAYYTSSRTRRTGSDGLTIDESREADTASGRASHQVSRGIHDKGHTVVRKLNSDGRVGTMETLHNLNEEELAGFEEAWKGKARKHLTGWSEGFNVHDVSGSSGQNGQKSRGNLALPSTELGGVRSGEGETGPSYSKLLGKMKADAGERMGSSGARARRH